MTRKFSLRMVVGSACVAVIVVLIGTVGCMQPIQGKTYDEVVAELGPPNACDKKPDGSTYCSWIEESNPNVNWEYHRVMLFDSKGRLVKSYPQSRFTVD